MEDIYKLVRFEKRIERLQKVVEGLNELERFRRIDVYDDRDFFLDLQWHLCQIERALSYWNVRTIKDLFNKINDDYEEFKQFSYTVKCCGEDEEERIHEAMKNFEKISSDLEAYYVM